MESTKGKTTRHTTEITVRPTGTAPRAGTTVDGVAEVVKDVAAAVAFGAKAWKTISGLFDPEARKDLMSDATKVASDMREKTRGV
jgi:hypothetical protein